MTADAPHRTWAELMVWASVRDTATRSVSDLVARVRCLERGEAALEVDVDNDRHLH